VGINDIIFADWIMVHAFWVSSNSVGMTFPDVSSNQINGITSAFDYPQLENEEIVTGITALNNTPSAAWRYWPAATFPFYFDPAIIIRKIRFSVFGAPVNAYWWLHYSFIKN